MFCRFEDGTVSFLDILALRHGFQALDRLAGKATLMVLIRPYWLTYIQQGFIVLSFHQSVQIRVEVNKIRSQYNQVQFKVRKKAKIWNRYNQASHLTQDTTWERDKNSKKDPQKMHCLGTVSNKKSLEIQ